MSLNQFKDDTARAAFGMTKQEALLQGLCINCKKPPQFYSLMGRKEYGITGLCEYCFDLICDPDKCQHCEKPASFHINKPKLGECDNFTPKPSDFVGD